MRKHGLKVLGLALMAALGLMAYTASLAQAAEALKWGTELGSGEVGQFLINKVLTPTALNKETASGKTGVGALLVPEKSIEIVCAEGRVTEGFVANEYEDWHLATPKMKVGGHGHGTILFLGCETWEIGPAPEHKLIKKLPNCEPNPKGLETLKESPHITAKALLLLRKHEGVTYLVAEPLVNSAAEAKLELEGKLPFTTIEFGELCSLPAKVNVLGSVAIALPATDAVKPKISIDTLAGSATQTLLGTGLKFGGNPAFIKGEGEVELTGPNKLNAWGGM